MITSRKRDRSEIDAEEYTKTKRIIHDGFQSLSLSENHWPSQLPIISSDELYRKDSAESVNGHNNANYIAPSPHIEEGVPLSRINSVESEISSDGDSTDGESHNRNRQDNEFFQRVFKGGRNQYVRKVDYLVDELIRQKTQRLQYGNLNHAEGIIPSSIGPHPGTDLAISSLIPYPVMNQRNFPSSSSSSSSSSSASTTSSSHSSVRRSEHDLGNPMIHGERYWKSNDMTHSDWEIEELYPPNPSRYDSSINTNNLHSDDMNSETNDSTMSCCDDEEQYAPTSAPTLAPTIHLMPSAFQYSSPPITPHSFPTTPQSHKKLTEEDVEDVGAF